MHWRSVELSMSASKHPALPPILTNATNAFRPDGAPHAVPPPLAPPMPPLNFDPERTQELPPPADVSEAARRGVASRSDAAPGDAGGERDPSHILQELQTLGAAIATDAATHVSKDDLARILEGFAHVLRDDEKYSSLSYADHLVQVDQM